MNRGILFVALAAFVGSTLVQACRRSALPEQLATLDSLTTALEAATLTLNELDVRHYATADSIWGTTRHLFLERFADTLDRTNAATLGEQFLRLRAASRMAIEHRKAQAAIDAAVIRVNALRGDLAQGAIDREAGHVAFLNEQHSVASLDTLVQHVIVNYRSTQRALEFQATMDRLLVDNPMNRSDP